MNLATILSFLYFLSCAAYLYYGLYILSLNTKVVLNRVFFVSCLSLALWAFSFSISNMAPTYAECLIWRRIGSFGWGPFYGFLLHFILLLTDHSSFFKKKLNYLLLYLPSMLIVSIYGLSTKTSSEIYDLVRIDTGWISISYRTIWDVWCSVYYISYCLIGIALIVNWGIKKADESKRAQAIIISSTFLLALLTGTVTEFIANSFFSIKIPQLAPLIILIPQSGVLYCIKKYRFINKTNRDVMVEKGEILSKKSRLRLYALMSLAYLTGGFMTFAIQFFTGRESLKHILIFGSIMVTFGLLLQIIQTFKFSNAYKDKICGLITAASIPIIVLKYWDYSAFYAGIVPIIFIVFSIPFRNKETLRFHGIASLLTLLWIWYKSPIAVLAISGADHILRIFIVSIVIFLAFQINRIYIQRLSENEEKLEIQKLLADISSVLAAANESNIRDRIHDVLRLWGSYFKADQAYAIILPDQNQPEIVYVWDNPDFMNHEKETARVFIRDIFKDESLRKTISEKTIYFLDESNKPDNGKIQEYMEGKALKTLILHALTSYNDVTGLIGMESSADSVTYNEYNISVLKVFADMISDVHARVKAERELKFRADFDDLTGLPNRSSLIRLMQEMVSRSEEEGKPAAIMFVDIDSFKYLNDAVGHNSADRLLIEVGKRLSAAVAPCNTVSRVSGDEFVILMPEIADRNEANKIAKKVIDIFMEPISIEGLVFHVTVSAGTAVYPYDGTNAQELLINADSAMYAAKESGKNRYVACSPKMIDENAYNANLAKSLHQAMRHKEFVLHYQPQVDLHSGEIAGFEALIRWNHPKEGLISPGVFIPIAERAGLMTQIGEWVLREACTQRKKWEDMGLHGALMSVNISLSQILHADLEAIIKRILQTSGLKPQLLELEITEQIAADDSLNITSTLDNIRKTGVKISIDDFGKEYSSLNRLSKISADKLKIDMKFIHEIGKNRQSESIIRAMLYLGREFNMKTLAEGVESENQLEFMKNNQCDQVQGYLYYKPMPPEDIEAIIRDTDRKYEKH